MKNSLHSPLYLSRQSRGTALIIALAFVVLLSALMVAFLSSTTINRQVSKSGSSLIKTKLVGQGVIDTIIGDLRQEIVATSAITTNAPYVAASGTVTVPLYRPSYTNAMPVLSGPPQMPPNLLKASYTGTASYPGGPSRTSAFSTKTPSQNGRYVSASRWNKPLLLPKKTPTSTTDLTPLAADGSDLLLPYWILMAHDGSNPTSYNANLANPQSTQYVTGRFAYTVYNEGGLLDANVAGYHSAVPAASIGTTSTLPTGTILTVSQMGPKTTQAFADLTQIGLSQAQIDTLVGWRNYASAQPTGAFPSYAFASAAGIRYYNAAFSNNGGLMTVNNTAVYSQGAQSKQSDRAFTSRQNLIQFLMAVVQGQDAAAGKTPAQITADQATAQLALQYLGTHSLDPNQPSYWPDPSRPRVYGTWDTGTVTPSSNWFAYQGNNDAAPAATGGTGLDDVINPPFLSVLVGSNSGTSFTRYDGTTAALGEPLVKKRFPLCRLAWLTYLGPSATAFAGADATYKKIVLQGVNQQTIDDGTAANIYACFGLTWGAAANTSANQLAPGNCWTYNHGATHIMKLSEVAKANREPDFFELLKAAICTGSLGKGAATSEIGSRPPPLNVQAFAGIYQHTFDTTTDYQIIQIGANIIDQFDADGYPSWIQFNNNSTFGIRDFFGIENLPYLHSFYNMAVQTAKPITAPVSSNLAQSREVVSPVLGGPTYPQTSGTWTPYPPVVTGTIAPADRGQAQLLVMPIIWNPHDTASSPGYPSPSSFQFTADSYDPSKTSQTRVTLNYFPSLGDNGDSASKKDIYTYESSSNFGAGIYTGKSTLVSFNNGAAAFSITPDASKLTFNATGTSTMFHEPTVLMNPGLPVGSNLAAGPGNTTFTDANDSKTYLGVQLGSFPMRWSATDPYLTTDPNTYNFTTAVAWAGSENLQSPDATVRLAYQNSSGAWQIYDQKYTETFGNRTGYWINESGNATYGNGISYTDNWRGNAKGRVEFFEPRSARFGAQGGAPYQYGQQFGLSNPLPNPSNVIGTTRYNASDDGGPYFFFNCSPGSGINPGPLNLNAMGWHETKIGHAMFAQNNPKATIYYCDADGVVRRGMAAYMPTYNGTPVSLPTATAYNIASQPAGFTASYGNTGTATKQSRPIVLNRPFRSVAELGYVFRDDPYKNLDFQTPESGDAALLDVFCIAENSRSDGLVAGKINLNTQQPKVLQALLAGAGRDETQTTSPASNLALTSTEATNIAAALVARTGSTTLANKGQLGNIAELVGKYISTYTSTVCPQTSPVVGGYDGFTSDLGNASATPVLYSLPTGFTASTNPNNLIQRYIETSIRALSDVGTTRTWNLLIDVIAQTGRYPTSALTGDNFTVEGEQRYWVHVTIDRYTGKVLDENVEIVKE